MNTEAQPGDARGAQHELAQLNVAVMRAPLDSPTMAEFVANIESINAVADASPGFVWRLQTEEEGDATAFRPMGENVLINLSVWQDVESLKRFVYRSAHSAILRRRDEWFVKEAQAYVVLWWVPAGHRPTVAEAALRLDRLRTQGPTAEAFGFGATHAAPNQYAQA